MDLDTGANRIIIAMGINPVELDERQFFAIMDGMFDDDSTSPGDA